MQAISLNEMKKYCSILTKFMWINKISCKLGRYTFAYKSRSWLEVKSIKRKFTLTNYEDYHFLLPLVSKTRYFLWCLSRRSVCMCTCTVVRSRFIVLHTTKYSCSLWASWRVFLLLLLHEKYFASTPSASKMNEDIKWVSWLHLSTSWRIFKARFYECLWA